MSLNLEQAKVVGFFSLPSASLAEANPTAYNNAMAGAPARSGTCAHCGNGILHHVVVEIDSARYFIGNDCAERVGSPALVRCIKARMTSEEMAAKEERLLQEFARMDERQAAINAVIAARAEKLKDIIFPLEASENQFHRSLAEQLKRGSLSERQANYVCKALIGRLTKKTDSAWTAMHNRVSGQE